MKLRQLQYFVAAVEAGSITRAAREMCVAQPALGAQLRELEEELGVPLLVRHSRGVEVTEAGHLFHERCRQVLQLLEQTRRDLLELHARTRVAVRLGLTTTLTMLIGTDLQLWAERACPNVALTLVEAPSFSLVDAVGRGDLDVALAYDVEASPGLERVPVLNEDLVFVAKPGFVAVGTDLTLARVCASRLAVGAARDVGRRALAKACGKLPEELPLAFEVQSVAAIRELVLRGEAASILPIGSVTRDVSEGRLEARRIADADVKMTLFVVRREGTRSGRAAGPAAAESARLVQMALAMIIEKAGPYISEHVVSTPPAPRI